METPLSPILEVNEVRGGLVYIWGFGIEERIGVMEWGSGRQIKLVDKWMKSPQGSGRRCPRQVPRTAGSPPWLPGEWLDGVG